MTMRITRFGPWAALGFVCLSVQALGQEATVLGTDQDRLSYALGMDLGAQLRRSGVAVDPAIFAGALTDSLAGNETLMTPADAQVIIQMLQMQLQRRQAEAKAKAALGPDPGGTAVAEPAEGSAKPQAAPPLQRVPGPSN
jgi:hypothetical protein